MFQDEIAAIFFDASFTFCKRSNLITKVQFKEVIRTLARTETVQRNEGLIMNRK